MFKSAFVNLRDIEIFEVEVDTLGAANPNPLAILMPQIYVGERQKMKKDRIMNEVLARSRVLGMAAFFVLVGSLAMAQEPVKPVLTIPVSTTPPLIDGELKDACWQKAATLNNFFLFQGKGVTSSNITAKVVRDNEWLYVSFEIVRPHPEVIQPTVLNHDGNVSADDSVEIFLDPGTAGKVYYHFILNAANARAERQCRNLWDKDLTWDTPWRSATKITSTGWQAEIGIPLIVLAGQGDLSKATLNLCANRVLVTLNYMNLVVGNVKESSSWAPVKGGFHEPLSFGSLLGMEADKIMEPLLVGAQAVKAGNYASDDQGHFYYEVGGTLRSYCGKAGKVSLMVEDKPATGKGETISQEIEITKAGDTPFAFKIPVSAFSGRTAVVSLRDPLTGEILQSVTLRDMSNLSLMRSYARYSYYTSEKTAAIACEIGLPDAEVKKVGLVAKDKEGKTLAEMSEVSAQTFIPVPASELQLGDNVVVVELRRKSGETLYSQNVTLIKRAPKPGCEWKVDRANQVILNNGKPFFIFGVMGGGNNEDSAKDLADIGFNTVVRWNRCSLEDALNFPELARKYGFYVVDFPAMCYQLPKELSPQTKMTEDESYDWSTDNVWLPGVKKLMNHPNVIAWYLADEPQDNRSLAARILRLYKKINEVDGYHPAEVLYIPPVPEGDEFSRNCDILGIDPYWVPGSGTGEAGTPNSVGRQTWLARQRSSRDLKLAWITPCAERFSGTRLRILAENEQRVQTYLSLIHGAKSLLYFVYPFLHESTRDTFAQLAREMKVIGPACVEPDVAQNIRYTPVAFDPHCNLFPDVQVALKKNPAGGYILLAANFRPYPVEATFKVSLLEKGGRVSTLFVKNGEIAHEKGVFADHFAAMDTRAYALKGVHESAVPVDISVAIIAHPEKTDRFLVAQADLGGGGAGKKNLLGNAGFEQCSIPGMPDYYTDFRTAKTKLGWRLGDKRGDALVGIETNKPYEGKNCLRMNEGCFLFQVWPKDTTPGPYVISAYVRGSAEGDRIGFYGVDRRQSFALTKEWQRISATVQYPFKCEKNLFGFNIVKGTVWIDAMQFEKGTTPTDFER